MGYHLGLSSSTGQLADNHDIIMLKTYEVDLVEGQTFDAVVSGIWCCCVISVDNKHVNQSFEFSHANYRRKSFVVMNSDPS